MTLAIAGYGSKIVSALLPMLPAWECTRGGSAADLPDDAERYLFCAGYLAGRQVREASPGELASAWTINFTDVVGKIERLIERNNAARIVVVGSESGISGSFDFAYAGAKAALHTFVENKRLRTEDQQLVCVAPGIIRDAGMTERRNDRERLAEREARHPKGRFLECAEVARLIHFLLYEDQGYISGVTIRVNGGEHACR